MSLHEALDRPPARVLVAESKVGLEVEIDHHRQRDRCDGNRDEVQVPSWSSAGLGGRSRRGAQGSDVEATLEGGDRRAMMHAEQTAATSKSSGHPSGGCHWALPR